MNAETAQKAFTTQSLESHLAQLGAGTCQQLLAKIASAILAN